MRKLWILALAGLIGLATFGTFVATAGPEPTAAGMFGASLSGFEEVPAISTAGEGTLQLRIRENRINFTLTYSGLGDPADQAHIHFGRRATNGGVMAFLCGGAGPEPACPGASGTVQGTIVAAEVQAIAAQGIAAGQLGPVKRAIRNGAAYANVHTATFASGEIRGMIHPA